MALNVRAQAPCKVHCPYIIYMAYRSSLYTFNFYMLLLGDKMFLTFNNLSFPLRLQSHLYRFTGGKGGNYHSLRLRATSSVL